MELNLEKYSEDLLERVLRRYEGEYLELTNVWKNLESKAQGNVAISGLLISVSGFFMNGFEIGFLAYARNIIAISIIFLAISVACSIFVLIVQPGMNIPSGEGYEKMARAILNLEEEELKMRKFNFLMDECSLWKSAIDSRRKTCVRKAKCLRISQCLLLLSLMLLSSNIVVNLYRMY